MHGSTRFFLYLAIRSFYNICVFWKFVFGSRLTLDMTSPVFLYKKKGNRPRRDRQITANLGKYGLKYHSFTDARRGRGCVSRLRKYSVAK